MVHGPSCSAAYGIFPDQGSSRCPLNWQADSYPLSHQGSLTIHLLKNLCASINLILNKMLKPCFCYLNAGKSEPGWALSTIRSSDWFTHTLVHHRCRHNSHKVETGQMLISDWMDKQTVVDPLDGTVFNHNQEWSTDAYYNMCEPQKTCLMKKSDTGGHIFIWFHLCEMSRIGRSTATGHRLNGHQGMGGEVRENNRWIGIGYPLGIILACSRPMWPQKPSSIINTD